MESANNQPRRIVIVGGGIAGLTAAQAARDTDPQAEISLICDEHCLPYFRTRLAQCISGQMEKERLAIHSPEWYKERRIKVIFGRATAIGRENKLLRLIDDRDENLSLPYDRLILASGGRGNMPNFHGNERENVIALRQLGDLQLLQRYPGPAVVIGGGGEALEVAYHLSQAGRDVTVIGRNKHLLHQVAEREASVFYLQQATKAGVRVALNGTVELFDGKRAVLHDGRCFEAALVVAAAGFRSVTNIAPYLVDEADRGFPVDDHMRCREEDIFACGDCAEWRGQRSGRWATAIAQGKTAGINAADDSQPALYQPAQSDFRLSAMSCQLWIYGDVSSEQSESRRDPTQDLFCKFFFREGRLCGAELIGRQSDSLRIKKGIDSLCLREGCEALWPQELQR